ncbi:MAG: TetR/AcrR family transcriptional regulator [Hyphomicrobiaceae bacterium]|nr:MAG: TetR/AcrR family transcriptional regulator [Hyphomicrobiaceae bacterium]
MARPRSFDEDKALDAAIACFWSRGLEATSVRDLAERMGIQGPSLYNAFGDKRALFARALERYATRTMRERIARFERLNDPKVAICTFIQDAIERSVCDPHRRGCLLVNSALEVAPHDKQLRTRIAAYLDEIAAFFRRNIAAAQAAGMTPETLDQADTARLLLGVLLGIRVLARANPDRALLEGVAGPALALLDGPAGTRTSKNRRGKRT